MEGVAIVKVILKMRSYIAHPFWDARNRVIEIEKKSGVNRQKSDEKRQSALKAECERQGCTLADYERLKIEAAEQWYRRIDRTIYIPRHQVAGAMVQTIGESPKALRGMFTKDNFRALVEIGDFETQLTERSGVFGRFVKLEGSNQRSYQENEFIGRGIDCRTNKEVGESFEAVGAIICDERQVATVKSLLTAAVERIGIGAARKMGFGRGTVVFES
jgi:hypothetical protein